MLSTDVYIARVLERASPSFGVLGGNIQTGYDLATTPDSMIMIVDVGSWKRDTPQLDYYFPKIQISVREGKGLRQKAAETANNINSYLQNWWGIVDDMRFVYINNAYGPMTMPNDDSMRPIFVINFNIMKCKNYI